MRFKNYRTQDFLEDAFFRKSILEPDSQSDDFWQSFLANFPQQRDSFEEAKMLLNNIHLNFEEDVQEVRYTKAEQAFRALERKIKIEETRQKQKAQRLFMLRAIAASLVLLFVAIGIFYTQLPPKKQFFATGNGERLSLTLPDNSEVRLNANSKLYFFPSQWKSEELREVWLEGEAFFDVERKSNGVKFVVNASDMRVSVLGTQFNVRSRGVDSQVVLVEGEVELEIADQKITMEPGELVSYSQTKHEVELKKVQTTEYAAWKDGITVLNNTLREVVKELEILYGVKFQIKNEALANRKIQLSAPSERLEEVLKTLELLYPEEIRIKEENGQVIVF